MAFLSTPHNFVSCGLRRRPRVAVSSARPVASGLSTRHATSSVYERGPAQPFPVSTRLDVFAPVERHRQHDQQMQPQRQPASIDEQALQTSREVTSAAEMRAYIVQLRRSKLALLADDFMRRVRCIVPDTPEELLEKLAALSSRLLTVGCTDDSDIRTRLRTCLWEIRLALEPYAPPESVRLSLEVVRSGLLDCPPTMCEENDDAVNGNGTSYAENGDSDTPDVVAVLRSEMHHLMIENILLEELRSFRLLEREVSEAIEHYHQGVCERERCALHYSAACQLGLDEYRVRSKSRLASATDALRSALDEEFANSDETLATNVALCLDVLSSAIARSLESDLRHRRPAGEAMLLRPRVTDIPNFRVVSPSIMRGGQPSRDGFKWLLNCGVTLVIDLRGSDRANQWQYTGFEDNERYTFPVNLDTPRKARRDQVYQDTFRVHNIAIEDFDVPTLEQVDEFLSLVLSESAEGGIVFVHCKAGIGRTGTLIACWRLFCGESADDALAKESLYSTFGGGLKQESFVRDYASRLRHA